MKPNSKGRPWLGLCLTAAVLCLTTSPSFAAGVDLSRGRQLAERHCARCHAVGRLDESQHPAAPRFRELHLRWPVETLQEALGEGLITGHPEMPEFRFDAQEVAAFIAYLRSLSETPGE